VLKKTIIKLKNLIQFNKKSLSHTALIGKQGEQLAVDFLKCEKKYKIIASNWTYKKDEIDIIAKDADVLVFIEVKTRCHNSSLISQYESVTSKKKKALARACKAYLKYNKLSPHYFRFDIILVKFRKNQQNIIQHYCNIKLFPKNFHTLNYD